MGADGPRIAKFGRIPSKFEDLGLIFREKDGKMIVQLLGGRETTLFFGLGKLSFLGRFYDFGGSAWRFLREFQALRLNAKLLYIEDLLPGLRSFERGVLRGQLTKKSQINL